MTHTYTYFRRLALIALAGLLIVCNIWAQNEPVKNWAAPLYWQPSAREAAITKHAAEQRLGTLGMVPETIDITTPVPLVFVAVTPCRMMDTRGYDSTFVSGTAWGPPALTAGATRTVPVAGVTAGYCSLPAIAQAVSVNVTLWPTPGTQVQWITLWPAGVSQPAASTINDYQGTMYNSANGITMYGINNAAIVPLGTGGAFDIYVTNATNLFIDVNGYYAPIGDTNGDTMLGIGALQNNTGSNNTATGNDALAANTSGFYNTADGSGALVGNTTGTGNTASGVWALGSNTTGSNNTATGADALNANTTGLQNTATGVEALYVNSTGNGNTANGFEALQANTVGGSNMAGGFEALYSNTTGSDNTASGANALYSNTTASGNTATGTSALYYNSTGVGNTATGLSALQANTTGNYNTADGSQALTNNTGAENTGSGNSALVSNTTGSNNTAVGFDALFTNTTGSGNIAIGSGAGYYLTTGDSNIDIGNGGVAGDSGVTRIGNGMQSATYISGIYGVNAGGNAVYVTSSGQLSSASSSRRFKQDIRDMGDTTDVVMGLRPVRFRYKTQGADGGEQYGLIAEEVEEIAPQLVGRGLDGQIDSVHYEKVNAILLNQVQTLQRLVDAQKDQMQSQQQEFSDLIRRLEARLAELETRVK